jgi:lysophospholipase L1-like esterase
MRPQKITTAVFLSLIIGYASSGVAADNTGNGLSGYVPEKAPEPAHLVLKTGDKLAICGDSITEQKMYSRIMEDYLTMCVPDLKVTVRQYGWSGERAPGFLARMTNDCVRFEPTIATTCYGMNDHEYRSYQDRIGDTYRTNSDAIIRVFKAHGVRVIQGSPGCVGKVPPWQKDHGFTVDELNANLGQLRNIDIELAKSEKVGFADVFEPMYNGAILAHQKYSTNYNVSGGDGVHPGWAGHTVMAYAFLKSMGLDGDVGTFVVDLKKNRMKVSKGHEVTGTKDGGFEIKSSRYPFCSCEPEGAAKGYPVCDKTDSTRDDSIQSGMTLVPFNADLNRLTLIVKNASASIYTITWGAASKSFSAKQLEQGINLAVEFPSNPFNEAFAKVDAAVIAKQTFETREMKQDFRPKGNLGAPIDQVIAQTETVVKEDEQKHQELAAAVRTAFLPVTHVIKITAE